MMRFGGDAMREEAMTTPVRDRGGLNNRGDADSVFFVGIIEVEDL